MTNDRFTIIDDGRVCDTTATVSQGRVHLSPTALQAALGWELTPQGLCKDDRCVPVARHADLSSATGIDLEAVGRVLSRPLAVDVEERVAFLGTAATERAAQLASLEAPEFTLPDLAGRPHALSDYRGKKVLLVVYASW